MTVSSMLLPLVTQLWLIFIKYDRVELVDPVSILRIGLHVND